ncbi:BatD [uncultured Candidatus Thioglobus sp.]|nr:BatD [uncultured Candidatus Thioglobus sp.]
MIKKTFGNFKPLQALFLLLTTQSLALTIGSVDKSSFYMGDTVSFNITASGNNIVFPTIDAISGVPIFGTGSSQSIVIVNGQQKNKQSKTYHFKPSKSLTIPAYELSVNGNKEATKPIKITLKKSIQSKSGDDYIFQIKADKKTFIMGDTINFSVIFKQKKSLPARNVTVPSPTAKHLLFKTNGRFVQSGDKNYTIHILNYTVKADDFGSFTIPSMAAIINPSNNLGRRKIHSNTLTLEVKPLPEKLTVFGDFRISASTDKAKVAQFKAINLVLDINGIGSFQDIEKFELNIPNATVYESQPSVNDKKYQQKFAIIGQQDFVIPAFELVFFDKSTQNKKIIRTKPISIQVIQQQAKSPLAVENTVENTAKTTATKIGYQTYLFYLYLLLALLVGVAMTAIICVFKSRKKPRNIDLIKQIKRSANNKTLFDLLLPLDFPALEPFLRQLEANIYKGEKHKINKKDIIRAIKAND